MNERQPMSEEQYKDFKRELSKKSAFKAEDFMSHFLRNIFHDMIKSIPVKPWAALFWLCK